MDLSGGRCMHTVAFSNTRSIWQDIDKVIRDICCTAHEKVEPTDGPRYAPPHCIKTPKPEDELL